VQPLPPIDCDVSAFTNADAHALEALTRLQLTAHRMGTSIRLRNPSAQLIDLLALFGLSDVLPVVFEQAEPRDPGDSDDDDSAREMDG
jgi:ABC-type transporter Mla MlaB component